VRRNAGLKWLAARNLTQAPERDDWLTGLSHHFGQGGGDLRHTSPHSSFMKHHESAKQAALDHSDLRCMHAWTGTRGRMAPTADCHPMCGNCGVCGRWIFIVGDPAYRGTSFFTQPSCFCTLIAFLTLHTPFTFIVGRRTTSLFTLSPVGSPRAFHSFVSLLSSVNSSIVSYRVLSCLSNTTSD
jgi:hypothetical protein